jgi:hypothetical protein
MKMSPRRRTQLKFVIVIALFVSTFVAAYVLAMVGWHPGKTRNYGELVQPARPLPEVALTALDGGSVSTPLRGKWSLVYFGAADCPAACVDTLYKMRQLHAAQGRAGHRVRRVFIVTDTRALDRLRGVLAEYDGTDVYVGPAEAVRSLAAPFTLPVGGPFDKLHRLYVVDPLGNFMMSYPADADLRRMAKDLGVILRRSQVG